MLRANPSTVKQYIALQSLQILRRNLLLDNYPALQYSIYMTTKQLTKTLIKSCADCQKRLFLELNSPELKTHGEDAFFSHLASEGYNFEKIAVTLFPDAKKQEIFISNNVQIRTDVIDTNLTEIKSSTSVTDELSFP